MPATIDLSTRLAAAAMHLAAYAETSDLQDRNTFNNSINGLFKDAANNSVAIDAILHMSAELGKRDPAIAMEQLINLSHSLSAEDNTTRLIPLLKTIATPENVEAFLKWARGFPNSYNIGSAATSYLLREAIGFSVSNLTPKNADTLQNIAYNLAEKPTSPALKNYHRAAASILHTMMVGDGFSDEQRIRAAITAAHNGAYEVFLESAFPGFINGAYKKLITEYVLSAATPDKKAERFKYYIFNLTPAAPLMSQIAEDLFPRIYKAIKAKGDDKAALDFARETSTSYGDVPQLKALAWKTFKAETEANKHYGTPSMSNTYELYWIGHALAMRTKEERPAKTTSKPKKHIEQSALVELAVKEALAFADIHRDGYEATRIHQDAVKLLAESGQINALQTAFEHLYAPLFHDRTLEEAVEKALAPHDQLTYQLSNIGGVYHGTVTAGLFNTLMDRLEGNNALKLRLIPHFFYAMNDNQDAIDAMAKTLGEESAKNPNAAWPVLKKVLNDVQYSESFGKIQESLITLACAFMPYENALSQTNHSELTVLLRMYGLTDAEAPKLNRSHPAFRVKMP